MTREFTCIEQKNSNDCAIAALAMLTDIPYSTVRKTILKLHPKNSAFEGVEFALAYKAMKALGVKLRCVNLDKCLDKGLFCNNQPGVLIVPCRDPSFRHGWHAVYWTGKRLYDPSPTKKYGKDGKTAIKLASDVWQCIA